MLAPNFAAIPPELRKVPRWVVWKGEKVPYCPAAINSKASVTNPSTWAAFDQAQIAYDEGGYLGVGFVLNGDGIVGIDLDKCVTDTKPAPAALDLMNRIGCAYIEYSPSGNGLRGFGYGDNFTGKRGILDGLNVELYTNKRYLTVTGHSITQGPLKPLPGFAAVAAELGSDSLQKRQKETEETEAISSISSGSSGSSGSSPAGTLPASVGARNKCLFRLARWVKGNWPDTTLAECRPIVKEWHRQVLPVIGTKEFAESWGDFALCWKAVKYPHGATLETILQGVNDVSLPNGISALEYGTQTLRLVRICNVLASHHAPEPFFLSARIAGDLLEMHYTEAAKLLAALVADGVLKLETKGVGNKASRYRFIWGNA